MEARDILEKVKSGEISVEEAESYFRREPFEEMGYAKLDTHRKLRSGFAEVIFCSGKSDEHLLHIFGKLDVEQHEVLLQKFVEVYGAELCVNTQIYPGVPEFLKHCQTLNIKMACVTNKPVKLAQGLLDALELSSYFQVVLGGDSLPERKPHPLPLLHCMESLKISASQSLMIGDSSNDIEAARRAGIDCIVVSYGYNHGENIYDCQPQQVVDSLAELII